MTETLSVDELYVDPDHRLPDDEWGTVVRRANALAEWTRANAGGGAASGIAPVLDMTVAGIASRKYFGVSGIPTQLLVLHSAECPLRGGFAQSLTEWAATIYPQSPIASWQRFVDPFVRLRFIPDHLGAWHASEANVNSIGWEQAGYARFSRAEWLTPDGKTQMESLAFDMAEVALREGIPARWLTDAEVVAATHGGNRSVKGFCTHRQIDPDTRTDPGNGYPYDLLMERIRFYMDNGTTSEEDDMPTAAEVAQAVLDFGVKQEGPGQAGTLNLGGLLAWYNANRANDIEATAKRVMRMEVPWYGFFGEQPKEGRRFTTLEGQLGWMDTQVRAQENRLAELDAKLKALAGLVADKTDGVTKEELLAQLDASVKDSLKDYTPVLVKNPELEK